MLERLVVWRKSWKQGASVLALYVGGTQVPLRPEDGPTFRLDPPRVLVRAGDKVRIEIYADRAPVRVLAAASGWARTEKP